MPNAILEAAITAVIQGYRADRAGQRNPSDIQEKVTAAQTAGHTPADIFGEADRRFGHELIANADQYK
jgi:hypothetical protein